MATMGKFSFVFTIRAFSRDTSLSTKSTWHTPANAATCARSRCYILAVPQSNGIFSLIIHSALCLALFRYYTNEVENYGSPYGYSQSVATPQNIGYDISADYVDSTTTYEPRNNTIVDSDFIGLHSKLWTTIEKMFHGKMDKQECVWWEWTSERDLCLSNNTKITYPSRIETNPHRLCK